jgi:hypothetical protein
MKGTLLKANATRAKDEMPLNLQIGVVIGGCSDRVFPSKQQ